MMANPRSKAELLKFLEYVGAKGLMSPSTAESRKASVNKLLSILSDEEASDVANIDLDEVARRFANLHGQQYRPDSLQAYKSRTRSAIADFVRYVENPLGFKIESLPREKRTKPGAPGNGPIPARVTSPVMPEDNQASQPSMVAASILPIAIRADLVVRVQGLPFDLTPSEAKKIANVIQAMALEQ